MKNFFQINKPIFAFLISFLFCATTAVAQNRVLKGTVTDQAGEPLIGVTVVNVNDTRHSTVTDLDGNYSIRVKDGTILKFSYVGCKTKAVNVPKGKNQLNVVMEEESIMLEQTVVVGMNMKRSEKSLSTAYQKMDVTEMTEVRDAGFVNMLSGKVAGLQVISNGPSGSATVHIRGMNSITGNNAPLYVIDGVPIVNESGFDEGDTGLDYGNVANSINPDAIEDIVVLKGANATAIYGSEAANGAIVITTKKASANQRGLGVSFSTNLQFTKLLQMPIYQNVYGSGANIGLKSQYSNVPGRDLPYNNLLPWGINQLNGSGYNQASWGLPMIGFDVVGRNGIVKTYSPNDGNITDMYEVATTWTNNVSVEKKGDKYGARLSLTNMRANDILENFNKINRNQFQLHVDFRPIKFLYLDINAQYNHETGNNRGSRNGTDNNPLFIVSTMPRDVSMGELVPWKRPDHRPTSFNGFKNPYWLLNETSNQDKKDWLLANIAATVDFCKELKLRLRAAMEQTSRYGWTFANLYSPHDYDGDFREFWDKMRSYNYEALLMFDKRWKKNFQLSATLGTSFQDYWMKQRNVRMPALFEPDIKSMSNAGGYTQPSSNYNAKKKIGLFGTASLGFRDYLYLDVTMRNDWSSTLPSSNRSYLYYSFGTSFIVTEAFKKVIPNKILSFAKLRASYARVGNDTGFDQLLASYSYGRNYLGYMSYYESDSRRRNAHLKPERTASVEAGMDLRFWDNRINVDFTYYTKTTRDQIVNAEIDGFSGYTSAVLNAGKIRNWGTELTVGIVPIRTKTKWEWKVDFNYSNNRSKVISLANNAEYMKINGTKIAEIRLVKGQSFGSIYANSWQKNESGQNLVDASGAPIEQKGVYLGDVAPKWMGGLRNTLKWRDLQLSVLLDIKVGGNVWSGSAYEGARSGGTVQSLEGRDAYLFSSVILNENADERKGLLGVNQSINGGQSPYGDIDRVKGPFIPNAVFRTDGTPALMYLNPELYWNHSSSKNGHLYIYDASYVKLREVSLSYRLPRNVLKKLGGFIQSASVAVVGRNLAILHQNTPKGIDPESTTTMGSGQGLENGFSLPSSSYGFNVKVTF